MYVGAEERGVLQQGLGGHHRRRARVLQARVHISARLDAAVGDHRDAERAHDLADGLPVGAPRELLVLLARATVEAQRRCPGLLQPLAEGNRRVAIRQKPQLDGDRYAQVRCKALHQRDHDVGLVEQEGAVPPLSGDALRASKVEVDSIRMALDMLCSLQHRCRIVAGKLCKQGPATRGLRIKVKVPKDRYLVEQPRMQHRRVRQVGA